MLAMDKEKLLLQIWTEKDALMKEFYEKPDEYHKKYGHCTSLLMMSRFKAVLINCLFVGIIVVYGGLIYLIIWLVINRDKYHS